MGASVKPPAPDAREARRDRRHLDPLKVAEAQNTYKKLWCAAVYSLETRMKPIFDLEEE